MTHESHVEKTPLPPAGHEEVIFGGNETTFPRQTWITAKNQKQKTGMMCLISHNSDSSQQRSDGEQLFFLFSY